jgi:transcriptional regulator GlxA family with amidase domain
MPDSESRHQVAVLALPGMLPLDFGIPVHAFDFEPYNVVVCGEGPVEDGQTHAIVTPPGGLDVLETADTVIVPGYFSPGDCPSEPVIGALRSAFDRGARLASICIGAFALGYAGLLDNREATTHWLHLDRLAATFPAAHVRRDVLYVSDGQVHTSAGVASGIDLCLAMIRADLGATVANQRGRMLVAAPHRSGDQRQFIEHFTPQPRADTVSSTRTWIQTHLDQPLTLVDMASHANMSIRNFSRRFFAETGVTPKKWLQAARIDRACELLEATDYNVERVARGVGLGTPANFRRVFFQYVGVTPHDYRRLYRGPAAAETAAADLR